MGGGPFSVAIETTTPHGSIAVAVADRLLESTALDPVRRHNLELAAEIDRLLRKHGAGPADLGRLFLSIGPGSFTGLRIAVATAKMLAYALPLEVFAVPTIEVVVANVPAARSPVAVCLSRKQEQVYGAVYRHEAGRWRPAVEPAVRTWRELLAAAPRPLAAVGEIGPLGPDDAQVQALGADLAKPRSDMVWALGLALARRGLAADPHRLEPLYARRPEAVERWEASSRNQAAASPHAAEPRAPRPRS
jgi:tRNA threonylcarbamoyladenosine biosynthesis protein TsaB